MNPIGDEGKTAEKQLRIITQVEEEATNNLVFSLRGVTAPQKARFIKHPFHKTPIHKTSIHKIPKLQNIPQKFLFVRFPFKSKTF